MKIQTKYSVGDHVLVKADKKVTMICPFCNGENSKIINGDKIYCQNCYSGKLSFRSNKREVIEGVITGLRYEYKDIKDADIEDDEDREDYTEVTDNAAILVSYFVDVSKDYYGDGTYEERQILRKV